MTAFKHITIEIIPHGEQRYETVGDWVTTGGHVASHDDRLLIRVSDTGDSRSNMAIALHELVEAVMCGEAGITAHTVDVWDHSHLDSDEPGALPGCPYGHEHEAATVIEMMFTHMIGLSWHEHETIVEAVGTLE